MSSPTASSRDDLMARVHAALGRSSTQPPAEPPPAVDESIARLARSGDDLVAMFSARAAATGMFVQRITSQDLIAAILNILQQNQVKSVVLGSAPAAAELSAAIAQAGVAIVDWKAAAKTTRLDVQFDTDCGITGVAAALAETGSLICAADAHNSRGLSLVPPLHIAIVRDSDILPDMLDYWASLRGIPGSDLPSNFVFITGPSKTADIEGELVTGVHGPEVVHVIVVEPKE